MTDDKLNEEEKAALALAAKAAADEDYDGDYDTGNEALTDEIEDLGRRLHDADTEIARLNGEIDRLTKELAAANKKAGVKIAKAGKQVYVLKCAVITGEGPFEVGDEISLDDEQAKYYRDCGMIE